MGVPAPHRGRSGNGVLRHDARSGAQRRRRHVRGSPRLRRRRSAFHARNERQRRGGALSVRPGAEPTTFSKKMSFIHIDSNMVPYISPEEYEVLPRTLCTNRVSRSGPRPTHGNSVTPFRAKYGANLMEEVARYADGGRAGRQGPRRAVRRDPRPRLAHLLRRHRRQARVGQAAGRAHARHGIRPQRRERQYAGLRHRTCGHARRGPRDRRFEPYAQHRHQPLRRSGRKGRDGAQRRALRRRPLQNARTRREGQDRHLPRTHHLPERSRLLRRGGRQGAQARTRTYAS